LVFEFTDRGVTALELDALKDGQSPN
jgi:hypothetical protein